MKNTLKNNHYLTLKYPLKFSLLIIILEYACLEMWLRLFFKVFFI
jgi:hypothetical protein